MLHDDCTAKSWSFKPSTFTNLTVSVTVSSPELVFSLCTCLQARAAAEAMRATLSHVEAALEAREAELHDSWHALRLQAADLQSESELTPEMLQPDTSARVGAQLMIWSSTATFTFLAEGCSAVYPTNVMC